MKVNIKVPIWNGNRVGIKKSLLSVKGGTLEVEVLYTGKDGKRVFPYRYTMSMEKAITYPTHKGYGRVPDLVHIPIADFEANEIKAPEPLTEEQQEKQDYLKMIGVI